METTLFADGERVLCFHGPLIYEAKVLKTKPELSPVEYYIHYAGWSKNWDEWVPESRVLKYIEDNVKRQKELARLYGERSKKDNKKGSAKKKSEQIGNESRASTPSKEGNANSSLPAATTPSTATNSATKSESGNNNSSSANTSTMSRGNRKSIAAPRPPTPSTGSSDKKEDQVSDPIEDECTAPKQKRTSSHSNSEQRTSTSIAANNENVPPTPQQPTAAGSTTSSGDAPCVESEETYTSKLEVKIKIPDELKMYLTDDWYAVVREHKLIDLPAKITVQHIVDQYLTHKKSAKSTSASKEVAINDVLDGIVEYFNVMLGSQLLYKFERTQYADALQKHPDTPLSELYGSFHLLRLFVRLGSMLSYSALDQQAMQTLLVHLHDFLKFMVKNSAVYFSMSNFNNVDPEYVRNAQ